MFSSGCHLRGCCEVAAEDGTFELTDHYFISLCAPKSLGGYARICENNLVLLGAKPAVDFECLHVSDYGSYCPVGGGESKIARSLYAAARGR